MIYNTAQHPPCKNYQQFEKKQKYFLQSNIINYLWTPPKKKYAPSCHHCYKYQWCLKRFLLCFRAFSTPWVNIRTELENHSILFFWFSLQVNSLIFITISTKDQQKLTVVRWAIFVVVSTTSNNEAFGLGSYVRRSTLQYASIKPSKPWTLFCSPHWKRCKSVIIRAR